MNNDSPQLPPNARKWWVILIATATLGPFVPFLCTGMNMTGPTNYEALMIGTSLWLFALILASAITGWHMNARRDLIARVSLTLLFILAACVAGFGIGFAECATAKTIWPRFPL